MSTISLRLPDEIETRLRDEARNAGKSQSEIARLAITEYLERREKERFMAEIVKAARELADDSTVTNESRELAEDLIADGLDTVIENEQSAPDESPQKWWK
jgi:predicted DNA-binding protein